ncbi:hypothetical protein [Bradyrhizobium sp. 30]|uniref:hypothetical protein n=1 Tax=Bradyrhizobium sp. 30 TaxID=2782669 RepID=UPI001FFAD6F2|nr:hypothetical protein [Bradyrhizobium sp. 30]MCK1294837.1 hypothetical protein [Bradyrhizobium sp. 30]
MEKYARAYLCLVAIIVMLAEGSTKAAADPTSTNPRFTLQGPAEPSNSPVIKDALNRPCLDVEAAARPHVVDTKIVDHVVSIKNNCARKIKVKVCYFNSEHCNLLDVAPYHRVDTVLGTMRGVTFFRYSMEQH